MKLDAVAVKNFRGYADEQEVAVGDLTTIVGKNDVGKSTILEALAIFFGSDLVKPDIGDANVGSGLREFEVTCTFSELPVGLVLDAQAETTLSSEYLLTSDGRLTVKKRWDCSGAKPKEEVFVLCHHPSVDGLSDLLLLANTALKTRLSKFLSTDEIASVNKSNNPAMRQALWASVPDLCLAETEVPVAKEDSKRIWERIAPVLPHFALFQSDRASRDSDSEVQDPMKLAIAAALAETGVQAALTGVVEAVRIRATELASRTHDALGELDPELADGLVPIFKSDPRWASLFSIALEGSDGIPLNKRGSGVRRLVLVSFFRAEAQRLIEEGSKRSVIYAIEEPETSQHPRNQRILLESFQTMARAEGCQVLLTTHSPGLAGHLPVESLRFVSKAKGRGPRIEVASEDSWDAIANDLGILPDDRVRVLICVEGPNDVVALKALSKALNSDGTVVVDLSSDKRFAFVPLGGGTLQQWVSERYLRGFGRPEFHIYDNDVAKYQDAVDEVNGRSDGSSARLTTRREMENYLHPDAIESALGVAISFGFGDDVPLIVSTEIKTDATRRPLNTKSVKSKLAQHAFPKMTRQLLEASLGAEEVTSWLEDLDEMASILSR
jgi:putative ATP-dependent endonuclease of OLD family